MVEYNIESHIRSISKKNLIFPGTVFIIILLALIFTPFIHRIIPSKISSVAETIASYDADKNYVQYNFNELHYTGVDYIDGEKIKGHYYFALEDKKAVFILISANNLKSRPDSIPDYSGRGEILTWDAQQENVIQQYAESLQWTVEDLSAFTSEIYISEVRMNHPFYLAAGIFVLILLFLSFYGIITNIVYLCLPDFHPACLRLKQFGSKKLQLKALNYELENGIVMIVGKIIITKNYLVEFSSNNLIIVPLVKINRVYESTRWHKFLWIRTKLTYTLNMEIKRLFNPSFSGNSKEEITSIVDYLQTNYIDTKVGYCAVKYKKEEA